MKNIFFSLLIISILSYLQVLADDKDPVQNQGTLRTVDNEALDKDSKNLGRKHKKKPARGGSASSGKKGKKKPAAQLNNNEEENEAEETDDGDIIMYLDKN